MPVHQKVFQLIHEDVFLFLLCSYVPPPFFKCERLFLLLIYTNMHIYTRTNVHIIYYVINNTREEMICNNFNGNCPSSRTLFVVYNITDCRFIQCMQGLWITDHSHCAGHGLFKIIQGDFYNET